MMIIPDWQVPTLEKSAVYDDPITRASFKDAWGHHETEIVRVGRWEAPIDRGIARLVRLMWQHMIPTETSCQEQAVPDGSCAARPYVRVPSGTAAERFFSLLDPGLVQFEYYTGWHVGMVTQQHEGHVWLETTIAFPKADIAKIESCLAARLDL